MPICPTDSVSSDIIGRPGASQFSNAKASDFSQANQSVSLSSGSIQPSPQYPISPSGTSTDIPNQLDWSVDFNSNVKPALNVKLERILIPGAPVWCVRFSPDGKYLAVGVLNGMTYIYDVKTGVKSWSVTLTLVWRHQLTFVAVFSQITPKQQNQAFGVSVFPQMVNT